VSPNGNFDNAARLKVRNSIVEYHRSRMDTWFQWLFGQLPLPEKSNILELGSGPGDLWVENWSKIPAGWNILASDLSPGMVEESIRRIKTLSSRSGIDFRWHLNQFHFAVIHTERLPFKSQSWDAVLAFGLLDLVPNIEWVLREIQRTLVPGGKFCTSAGGAAHLLELKALISPFVPNLQFGGDPERFGLKNAARFLAPFFEDISLIRYIDKLTFTTVEPIMTYFFSEEDMGQPLTAEEESLMHSCLTQFLGERGKIRITVEKGVFTGKRPII
jgi:ubiquinone/menaquinone biosynthesis C-methylase UbiE